MYYKRDRLLIHFVAFIYLKFNFLTFSLFLVAFFCVLNTISFIVASVLSSVKQTVVILFFRFSQFNKVIWKATVNIVCRLWHFKYQLNQKHFSSLIYLSMTVVGWAIMSPQRLDKFYGFLKLQIKQKIEPLKEMKQCASCQITLTKSILCAISSIFFSSHCVYKIGKLYIEFNFDTYFSNQFVPDWNFNKLLFKRLKLKIKEGKMVILI